MANTRSRSFVFTLNNYDKADELNVQLIKCKYLVYGREVGESGTPHLQGLLYFDNAMSFNSIKKKIPRAHIEVTSSVQASITYCKKDGDIYEYGEPPSQGKRTDIEEVKEDLESGATIRACVLKAKSMQSIKYAETYLKYFEKSRNWKPIVTWYWGATGVGKSKLAFEECEKIDEDEPYVAMSTGRWFEGYDAHSKVIIDDMRKDFMKFHELLRLIDRYPMRIECKGGSRQFLAKHIYITSCYHPEELFETREDVQQLIRRIDHILQVN